MTLAPTSASVEVGKTVQLTATVAPDDATETGATFASSDDGIAKVDDHGLVTGVAAGSADITVTTKDGGKTAKSTVEVTAAAEG